MSEIPEIPIEQVKDSAIKFDLCNLKLELDGTLEKLKGEAEALSQLQELLSDTLEKCSIAMAELEPTTPSSCMMLGTISKREGLALGASRSLDK